MWSYAMATILNMKPWMLLSIKLFENRDCWGYKLVAEIIVAKITVLTCNWLIA